MTVNNDSLEMLEAFNIAIGFEEFPNNKIKVESFPP